MSILFTYLWKWSILVGTPFWNGNGYSVLPCTMIMADELRTDWRQNQKSCKQKALEDNMVIKNTDGSFQSRMFLRTYAKAEQPPSDALMQQLKSGKLIPSGMYHWKILRCFWWYSERKVDYGGSEALQVMELANPAISNLRRLSEYKTFGTWVTIYDAHCNLNVRPNWCWCRSTKYEIAVDDCQKAPCRWS